MHDGNGLLVGRDLTIVTCDLRTLYFNLFTEPRTPRRMFENIGWNPAGAASGCMQSGSNSRSGRNRERAAVEVDAIGAEADAIRISS